MLLNIRQFSGERPKLTPRLLQENEAQVAIDCELVAGDLRAIRRNAWVRTSGVPAARTLFIIDDTFLTYAGDVDLAETPVDAAVRRVFITGNGRPMQLDVATGESYNLGVPQPVTPPVVVSVTGTAVSQAALPIDSLYRYTFVNRYGEEGDASAPSDLFTYRSGQRMKLQISASDNVDAADYAIEAYRLYRLVEGQSKFVGEYPLGQDTVVDALAESAVAANETISSEDFYLPPINLTGLHLMANGIALGFVGQKVYVSEPYNPNAWPYAFEVASPIVAVSSYDNYAMVLTTGYHEIAAIFDPRNISTTQLNEREPCVSKRGVVQGLGGVMFPSPSGLFYIGTGGARNLTQDYLDERDWQALRPETFTAAYRDGQYIAFYGDASQGGGWVFDSREGNAVVRQLSQWASAVYVREGTDDLHLVRDNAIELYQGGMARVPYRWRSKRFGDGSPFALTSRRLNSFDLATNPTVEQTAIEEAAREVVRVANAALVQARLALIPARGLGGAIGQASVADVSLAGDETDPLPYVQPVYTCQLQVFGDDALIHTETLDDEFVDRLDYSDRHRLWEIELTGTATLTQAALAGSGSELHTGN